MHKLVSHYHAPDIYSIDPDFFLTLGVKYIFADLDNAIEPYAVNKPSARAYALKEDIKERSLNLVLYSNKSKSKVEIYGGTLGVTCLASCRLPKTKVIEKFLLDNEISSSDVVFIGASIKGDCKMALKLKAQVILLDPLKGKIGLGEKIEMFFESCERKRAIKYNTNGHRVPVKKMEVI